MERTIPCGARSGSVAAGASKSQAQRLLICAALGEGETELLCPAPCEDILAMARCLSSLGAEIAQTPAGFRVRPIAGAVRGVRRLPCGESGATLRFLLPLCGALGAEAVFSCKGNLARRPLAPLVDCLCAHGMTVSAEGDELRCGGQLRAGDYVVAGGVSSQFVSGLLLALPLLAGRSTLTAEGALVSADYITMTETVLRAAKLRFEKDGARWTVEGSQRCALPARVAVEGDWSGAAVFLCMGALSARGVTVAGLSSDSPQGDRAVLDLLRRFGAVVSASADGVSVRRGALHGITFDADPIPDLIPPLAVLAAAAEGETRVENAARLRLKESDRLRGVAALLRALGASVEERADALRITPSPLRGGLVETCGDHRLAMAAALAACESSGDVTIDNDTCVQKSCPHFWQEFARLKGDNDP